MEYIVKTEKRDGKQTLDIYESYNGKPTRQIVSLKDANRILSYIQCALQAVSKPSVVYFDEEGDFYEI